MTAIRGFRQLLLFIAIEVAMVGLIWSPGHNLGYGPTCRLFFDHHDLAFFYSKGVVLWQDPSLFVMGKSEYPQVANWLFSTVKTVAAAAAPGTEGYRHYLDKHTHAAWADDPPAGPELSPLNPNGLFFLLFALAMGACLAGSIVLIGRISGCPNNGLVLLLPASLYFSANRFDIAATFVVLLSLWSVRRGAYGCGMALLGIAFCLKWFPLLIALCILKHMRDSGHSQLLRAMLAFGGTIVLCMLPTFLTGGLDAVLYPYRYHSRRGWNEESLSGALQWFLDFFEANRTAAGFATLSTCLQVGSLCLPLIVRQVSFEKTLATAVVAVGCFMMFSRIYSAQWLLWFSPLALCLARRAVDYALLAALDLTTYAVFPIAFDLFLHSLAFQLLVLLRALLIFAVLIMLFRREFFAASIAQSAAAV